MILPSGYSTYDYSVSAAGKGWGQGWPTCSNTGQAVTITLALSATKIPIHRRISKLALILLNVIERRGYLCGPYGTWGGECRAISGTDVPSNHSWWLAFDIRAPWNSYNSIGEHDIPDWAYALLRAYGFGLGADYTGAKKDWMHVEFMGTPADADAMTALAERNFGDGTTEEVFVLNLADQATIQKMFTATEQRLTAYIDKQVDALGKDLAERVRSHPYWAARLIADGDLAHNRRYADTTGTPGADVFGTASLVGLGKQLAEILTRLPEPPDPGDNGAGTPTPVPVTTGKAA